MELNKVASVFGLTVDDLMGIEERPTKPAIDPSRPIDDLSDDEVIDELERRVAPAVAEVTLGDYYDTWIERTRIPRRWAASTVELYRAYGKRWGPLLDRPLSTVAHADVQDRVNALLLAGIAEYNDPPHRRPLSATSVLSTVRAWRAALKDAVRRYKLISENPCDDLILPEPDRDEADAWTREEVEALIDALDGHPMATIFSVLLGGGFRIGEVLAHRWTDVDWKRGRIFTHATGTHGISENTKTRRRRWVPMPPPVMLLLKLHRAQLTWDGEFISEHAQGRRWGYSSVRRELRRLCERIGINPYGTHAARHHAASYLEERGVSLAAIARLLGNSPGTLTKRYLHASEAAIELGGELMSDLFKERQDGQSNAADS